MTLPVWAHNLICAVLIALGFGGAALIALQGGFHL